MTSRLVDAEILDTEIEAEYRGTGYERTVIAGIQDQEIELFEEKEIITDTDRGTVVPLELRGHLIGDLEVVDEDTVGLDQEPERDSKWSATLVGRYLSEEDSVADRVVGIDIGAGEMVLHLDDPDIRNWEFEIGDTLRTRCGGGGWISWADSSRTDR